MAAQTESTHTGEFLLSEAEGTLSREVITIVSGQKLKDGTVLAKLAIGTTATAAAKAGNTGNGTMGTVTVSAGALPGVYRLNIVGAATNAGDFELEGPDGLIVGTGRVAVAFSQGGLAFTLADGATDFVVGDGFTITVAAGSGKYTQFDDTATITDAEHAVAILYGDVDATGGDKKAVAIVRQAEVKLGSLQWPATASAGEKTVALAELAKFNVFAR